MTSLCVVYVTCGNSTQAEELADKLVRACFAACVNIIDGVKSVYLWEGRLDRNEESLLIIKTRKELVESLTKFVKEHHSYDCPEVIALPIEDGSKPYIDWLHQNTQRA